jgi:hypothetical protein
VFEREGERERVYMHTSRRMLLSLEGSLCWEGSCVYPPFATRCRVAGATRAARFLSGSPSLCVCVCVCVDRRERRAARFLSGSLSHSLSLSLSADRDRESLCVRAFFFCALT